MNAKFVLLTRTLPVLAAKDKWGIWVTNFLSAAAVSEAIQELYEGCRYIELLSGMSESERVRFGEANARKGLPTTVDEEVRKAVAAMRETAHAAKVFLDGLQSQPIIYAGEGSTDEVLAMIERMFTVQVGQSSQTEAGKKSSAVVQLEFVR